MQQKHNLLTILMLALVSTLLIFTACEKDEDDEPITEEPTNSAPTCTITSPEDGAEFTQGETITIAVEAEDEDNNLEEVRFYVNDVGIGSASSFPYNFDWDTNEEEPGSFTIKAEAIDELQERTSYEISITLESSITGGTLTDNDGNVYSTVQIGDQEWMAENLKTTTYNDGTSIDLVTDNTAWYNNTTGAYCWYDNDQATYADTYGALYNWHAVNTGNLCPDGWHVPTDAEWTALEDYIGSDGHSGTEGTALKATSGWNNDGNGTDDYGFTAHPGGYRTSNGAFDNVGYYGLWWSATETNTYNAWRRYLYYSYSSVNRSSYSKEGGFSVRCLRD
ncbi:Chitodextrinase precursor [Salinivirga cyanobacteriivorans]|uniref:Chitodextrinase n=1 Tax=Salinivirga cyanobacteriivorans TaxID=1307839 RepID=A0A0S2I2M5_9BACT|nr:FISUMP domain-containing protein [Salinivirga cyanobacteriivorans]ALO16598.1 Chitodextrinase precursor [Salinivirga cyanobacteriivorans]